MLSKIKDFLRTKEFVSVASCDFDGNPNAAPKFVLKVENEFICLVDYSLSKTWENLKINPKVSISFADSDTLLGYQVNGSVEIIDSGKEYEIMGKEFHDKEISLSTQRIIEGVGRGKKHEIYEASVPKNFVIYKVRIKEIVEIGPGGRLTRKKIEEIGEEEKDYV